MNKVGILNEFATVFEEESQFKHLVALRPEATPRSVLDNILIDDSIVTLDNDFYAAFKIEDNIPCEFDCVNLAATTLAAVFDRLVASNVHRLPLWSHPWSWDTWLNVKKYLGDGVTMILTPESETDTLKSFHPGIDNLDNFYVSISLPCCRLGRVNPAIICHVGSYNMELTIQDGPKVQIGQSVEINGTLCVVIDSTCDDNDRKQKLLTDKKFTAKPGDIAYFGGIGSYNLAMKKDAITVVTCPVVDCTSVVSNGLCYSIQEDGGILTFRLLMGIALTNPNNAIAIKG
jgi:hypothetical protein